jgi:putative ABC transport system substrate-binding protein
VASRLGRWRGPAEGGGNPVSDIRRRDFIWLIGSAAASLAWPLAAPAQQPDRVRRIGVLIPYDESDAQSRSRVAAFEQGLEKLGWTVGLNLSIDYRWHISDDARARVAIAELLRLEPDVVVVSATPAARAAQQATRTVPIVFTAVSEPVEVGLVAGLSHPGGNVTGFTNLESSVGEKWLELLKQIAPGVTRVAFMFNPDTTGTAKQFFRLIEIAAPKLEVVTTTAPLHGPAEIEPVMATLGHTPGIGLIVPLDTFSASYYKLITELAARYRLPAIYPLRQFATAGGLISYGPDVPDQFRRAATYVDRILRGEKPADLPVQEPTKFELVINLKTAKALGLNVPSALLVLADEVIE